MPLLNHGLTSKNDAAMKVAASGGILTDLRSVDPEPAKAMSVLPSGFLARNEPRGYDNLFI
jgi:hypothetical protein